jgi:hypothetical protein
MNKFITGTALIFSALTAYTQEQAPEMSPRRNTIKLDITSHWLYRDAVVVSYERIINAKRSWALIAGYQRLPNQSIFGNSVNVQRDASASGLKFGGEYRFYLAKENKFAAPRGVYIGPYFSYNRFQNERTIEVTSGATPEVAELNSSLGVYNLGVQLGYQFVFKDRWTIDLSFMGPSFSFYQAKFDLSGNYTFDPDQVSNEIVNDLINRFPGLGDLLAGNSVVKDGKMEAWAYGYRYQIQVGYRFGKK